MHTLSRRFISSSPYAMIAVLIFAFYSSGYVNHDREMIQSVLSSMQPTDWMSILYPLLSGVMAMNAVLMFLYWLFVRRVGLAALSAMVFASETVILLLLTASTGSQPRYDIAEIREWLVYARFFLFSVGCLHAILCITLLNRYLKDVHVFEVPKASDAQKEE